MFPKVMLIGGPGRTGTNLLKDIFRSHPECYGLPFESRFTVDPDGLLPTFEILRYSWSPFISHSAIDRMERLFQRVADRSLLDRLAIVFENALRMTGVRGNIRAYKEWELSSYFPGFQRHSEVLFTELKSMVYSGSWSGAPSSLGRSKIVVGMSDVDRKVTDAFSKFLNNLYSDLLARTNKSVYVDDNTFNIMFAGSFLDIFPEGHIVSVIRDPRDVVASYLKQRWTPNNPRDAAHYLNDILNRWFQIKDFLAPGGVTEIRLEDLCSEPRPVLETICSRMGFDFHEDQLRVPMDKLNSGRWQRELNEADQQYVSTILGDAALRFGYEI